MKNQFNWDYIIIGTGMGGGPIGLRLAQAGFSVLFLEKGLSPAKSSALKGQYAEQFPGERIEVLKKAGRFSEVIFDRTHKKEKKLTPFIGCGVGGSSALYGMVLERFKPSDFHSWPISYEELSNYYNEAEKLFQIKKNLPIRHPGHQELDSFLKSQNLNPYVLPQANEGFSICGECQSVLCKHKCKNDSGKICIEPAIKNHKATLITECDVQKIEVSNHRVTSVSAIHSGESVIFNARHVILAAGALKTPVILINSGIGNQSNLVGRNLMRHFVDLYALKIDSEPKNKHVKELGFNDFYNLNNQKLGTVQSFGRLPPVDVIIEQMKNDIKNSFGLVIYSIFKIIIPLMRVILRSITSKRLVMASIIEDSPQYENRVWAENGKTYISYKVSDEDQKKIKFIRVKLKNLFKKFNLLFISKSEENKMLAHVCGTCKMGTDPQTSVIDSENRVHGIENLYVVDSSFFPTSGGTNPALTIAANSLRVADLLISRERLLIGDRYDQKRI